MHNNFSKILKKLRINSRSKKFTFIYSNKSFQSLLKLTKTASMMIHYQTFDIELIYLSKLITNT